jgi:hypothetical protein
VEPVVVVMGLGHLMVEEHRVKLVGRQPQELHVQVEVVEELALDIYKVDSLVVLE